MLWFHEKEIFVLNILSFILIKLNPAKTTKWLLRGDDVTKKFILQGVFQLSCQYVFSAVDGNFKINYNYFNYLYILINYKLIKILIF